MAWFSLDRFIGTPRSADVPPSPKSGHKFVLRDQGEPSRSQVLEEVPLLSKDDLRGFCSELTESEWQSFREVLSEFFESRRQVEEARRELLGRAGTHRTALGDNPAEIATSWRVIRRLYFSALVSLEECDYQRQGVNLDQFSRVLASKLALGAGPAKVAPVRSIIDKAELGPSKHDTYPQPKVAARGVVQAFLLDQDISLSDDHLRRIVQAQ